MNRGRRIAFRVAKWCGIVVGALWLLYIACVNVLLRTRYVKDAANSKPQSAQVDFESAWSVLPGFVHVHGLVAYGQFRGFQYRAEIRDLGAHVALTSLLGHHPIVRVSVRGLGFRARSVPATSAFAPDIDPPIPFDPELAPPPPLTDESLAAWTLDVEDLDVRDGRELWLDAAHFGGIARAHGTLRATPNRALTIRDFRVDLRGDVAVANVLAFPAAALALDAKLDTTDPRTLASADTLRHLSVALDVESRIADLGFVSRVATLPAPLGGEGSFDVSVRVDHGRLEVPTRIDVSLDRVRTVIENRGAEPPISTDALDVGARVNLGAIARESADGPKLDAVLFVASAEVKRAEGHALVTAPLVTAHAAVTDVDLARLDGVRVVFDAHVPKAEMPDARELNGLLGDQGITIHHGILAAKLDVEGALPNGNLDGTLSFASDPFEGKYRAISFRGKLAGGVPFARASSSSDVVLAGTSVTLDGVALDYGTSHTRDWWMHARIPQGAIHVSAPAAYRGKIHVDFRDLDPAITALAALHGIPAWIHEMLGLGPYAVDATGVFGKHVKLDMLDARTHAEGVIGHPPARLRLTYDDTRAPMHMRATASMGDEAVGVEEIGDHIGVQLADVDVWFARAPVALVPFAASLLPTVAPGAFGH
jgi:hypothetical protein